MNRIGSLAPHRPSEVVAYIGLGSNVGWPEATLRGAVHALGAMPGVRIRGVSRLYATEPVGVTEQPEFRNAVVALDVPAGPDDPTGASALLIALKGLERAFGRRDRGRWGPRELDLDLLLFGDAELAIERPAGGESIDPQKAPSLLRVPHPSAHERLFVLAPLADLAPDLVPPGWGESVSDARDRQAAAEGPDAVRPIASWDASAGDWAAAPPARSQFDRPAGVALDGSPVEVYRRLPAGADARRIHDLVPPGAHILELGAGAGRVTHALVELGHAVTAVDESAEMLEHIRGAETVHGEIERLRLGRRFPALVLGSHLVNVVDPDLRHRILEACRRHVEDDGIVVVQAYDPDMDWEAAVGRPSRLGDVVVTVARAAVEGTHLEAEVMYEVAGRRWTQRFDAELLDDAAIEAELALAGLRFERWVARREGWLTARPCGRFAFGEETPTEPC